jgi:two-component sensor histidine kinase
MAPDKTMTITNDVQKKWQTIVNILAKTIHVPAALIMRLSGPDIEVFISSETEHNPYVPGAKEHFGNSGLYCETVIKTNNMLLVPNALSDDNWMNNPDIKLNMISYLGFPILNPDKTPFGTLCVLDRKENPYNDIHKELLENFRDAIERDIELIEKNYELQNTLSHVNSLLKEKEILLKEIHHRIKNNIASIGSLLSIQADSSDKSDVKEALQHAINRIKSIQIIYEKLLFDDNYTETSVKEYLEDLVQTIANSRTDNLNISIHTDIDDFPIAVKSLFPIGLIVNELITNSIKHAFGKTHEGTIQVLLKKQEQVITLSIQDNGSSFPVNFDHDTSNGFGLVLAKMLTQQLGGAFTIGNNNGTDITISFTM